MFKTKLRFLSLVLFPILLICSILFNGAIRTNALVKGWTPIEKEALSPEANGDNALGIVIRPSEESDTQINEIGKDGYPDLGSPQVFPFEAGLGSS
tara:strand:- start:133 stop:420 length:288 start_codon:yes stop_codon:yes gene_type:complete